MPRLYLSLQRLPNLRSLRIQQDVPLPDLSALFAASRLTAINLRGHRLETLQVGWLLRGLPRLQSADLSSNPYRAIPPNRELVNTQASFLILDDIVFRVGFAILDVHVHADVHTQYCCGSCLTAIRDRSVCAVEPAYPRAYLRECFGSQDTSVSYALVECELSECESMTDDILEAITYSRPKLRRLCLDNCYMLKRPWQGGEQLPPNLESVCMHAVQLDADARRRIRPRRDVNKTIMELQ